MPWLILGLTFAIIGVIASKAGATSAKGPMTINIKDPALAQWTPALIPLAVTQGIPVNFALAWIAVESAGRVCAVGDPHAKGPDGNPKELGLFQLYNPDDLILMGTTGNELRAYCTPGTQNQSRKLTPEEIVRHVTLGLKLIDHCNQVAKTALAKHGIVWQGKDMWRACKLVHALPTLLGHGLDSVVLALGHSPVSWAEYRTTYERVNPSAKFDPKKPEQSVYWRALENAERTGDYADTATHAVS